MPLPGARRQLDFDAVRSEAPQRPSFAAPPLAYSPDDPRALAAVRKVQGLVRGRMVRRAMRKAAAFGLGGAPVVRGNRRAHPPKRLAEASGADSKGTAVGKGRAGWSKVGATVRFVQAASFPQQREETPPGDALAREREREATRARLNPTEALSGAERDYWQAQAPSAFAAAGATLQIQEETRPMSAPLQGASPPTTPSN